MTMRLVTEARPILWEQLSEVETKGIQEADAWIDAVASDAKKKKPEQGTIETNRTGRVFFIDGPRGAGKTSILLTLLEHWERPESQTGETKPACREHLRVFLPVLDFDPLPSGMPLHGWLLEPWRKKAKELDAHPGASQPESTDLTELLADLYERAVTGWAAVNADGKGIVEKALEYQEKTSGWLETQQRWREFVGAVLCRTSGCHSDKCAQAHPHVFVIAIDDVDLQVERLPSLLHAIRLLHHPNVAYVLTGNHDHLRFVLKLDYMRRHEHLLRDRRHGEREDGIRDKIEVHSERLSEALLEKALPQHARLSLPHLAFDDLLRFPALKHTLEHLKGPLSSVARLQFITARQAQHAADRLSTRPKEENLGIAAAIELIADLCATSIERETETSAQPKAEPGEPPPPKVVLRGELTTHLSPIARIWKGDRLKITLRGQPAFAFHAGFDDQRRPSEVEAHRALLVQMLSEHQKPLVVAHALEWTPVAGILTTQVEWNPGSSKVGSVALFHWPWLVKPSAAQTLRLGALSARMSKTVAGNTVSSLDNGGAGDKMLIMWLLESIQWATGEESELDGGDLAFDKFSERLEALSQKTINNVKMKEEVNRWARQLLVMATPYFGLPPRLAASMKSAVVACVGKENAAITTDEQSKEQRQTVENAILDGGNSGDRRRSSLRGDAGPSGPELEELITRFLSERHRRLSTDEEKALWIHDLGKANPT